MLRIKCLGQLSVLRDDGQPFAGAASQPRRLAILALLARAGDRGITRETVIGYLWPDSDEERARRLLSQAVYMLRRDLGSDDAIVGVRDLRRGAGIVTSDVAEFQEARGASMASTFPARVSSSGGSRRSDAPSNMTATSRSSSVRSQRRGEAITRRQ